ncbi:MAG: hypothetical protein JWM59_2035 [Verrucomicrobiales bacterium]|nr:hypothetical protein [Verrucomicrobiales bacterium]
MNSGFASISVSVSVPPIQFSKTWPVPDSGTLNVADLAFSDPRPSSLPAGPRVMSSLRLRGMKRLTEIPPQLFAGHSLMLIGCPALRSLPVIIRPLRLLVLDGVGIESLPETLRFEEGAVLVVQNCCHLRSLPAAVGEGDLSHITIRNCLRLTALPRLTASDRIMLGRCWGKTVDQPLQAPEIRIQACLELEGTDGQLNGKRIKISDCPKLVRMTAPTGGLELLHLKNCPALPALPEGMSFQGEPAELILRECGSLAALPADMSTGTRIPDPQGPASLVVEAAPFPPGKPPAWPFTWSVRVRGVLLEPATVLDPEGIDPIVVLRHPNAEVRRVLLENLGMERLLSTVPHENVDEDTDPGGPRRLIQFQLVEQPRAAGRASLADLPYAPASEPKDFSLVERIAYGIERMILNFQRRKIGLPAVSRPAIVLGSPPVPPRLVCYLECRCPSTGRRYLLPVPPAVRTCRAAAAWMAGFDNPDDYAPLLET